MHRLSNTSRLKTLIPSLLKQTFLLSLSRVHRRHSSILVHWSFIIQWCWKIFLWHWSCHRAVPPACVVSCVQYDSSLYVHSVVDEYEKHRFSVCLSFVYVLLFTCTAIGLVGKRRITNRSEGRNLSRSFTCSPGNPSAALLTTGWESCHSAMCHDHEECCQTHRTNGLYRCSSVSDDHFLHLIEKY